MATARAAMLGQKLFSWLAIIRVKVVLVYMGYFVRQNRRQFRFIVRRHYQSGMDADMRRRESKGIDGWILEHEEVENALISRTVGNQSIAQFIKVGFDYRVIQVMGIRINALHDGAGQGLFLFVGQISAGRLA